MVSDEFLYLVYSSLLPLGTFFSKYFHPLTDKWKLPMTHWFALPLSLAGRVNLMKMVILSKFLYLFQHILSFMRILFFPDNIAGFVGE